MTQILQAKENPVFEPLTTGQSFSGVSAATSNDLNFPVIGFFRLAQIIGNKHANPPIPAIIPVSAATWWAKVKSGEYPQPVKLSANYTAWKVSDIKDLIDRLSNQEMV